jgi:very-short-patch-repair endonuclease
MDESAGPFTAAQAWAAGFTRSDVRRFVRCGQWILLRRGVYITASGLARADGDANRRLALDVSALRLALEWDAVAGGMTAARLWGFELLSMHVPRTLVVVTDDPDAVARSRADYVVRTAALPVGHRAIRHGVPVTSAARTALDLARTSPFVHGVVAVDSALRLRLVTVSELEVVLADGARWPGIERARRVVKFADMRSESVLESVSRVAMHEQGIAMPRTQVVIGDARVDFLWDDVRVVGEADGLGKYEPSGARTTRDIVRAEKRREEQLADAGFEVVRWGWEDARNPPRLARRLRAAFERGVERQRGRTAA